MIENEMMFDSQLPGADLEAKPKAKTGTPIVRVAIPVAVVGTIIGPVTVTVAVVGTIIGPVTVTVAVVGPVIRTIAAVAVPAVSISDILHRARVLSMCQH
jgi:hypothetical protein